MADKIYYCEVKREPEHDYWEFAPGIYAIPDRIEYNTKIRRCMTYSYRVWKQGSRGGVKIIKDRSESDIKHYGYVTRNAELMKEFMWVKLKAQPLKHYT